VADDKGDLGAVVLMPGEGRAIDLGTFVMSLKVAGDQTDERFSLLEAREPPNFGPPMHIHHNCGEAFFVIEGEYLIFVEDQQFRCPAGSFIYVPQGLRHGFRVGMQSSRKLNLYAPAAMVGYFDEVSSIHDMRADEETLGQIALRAGMEVVGPVPEGYL
jgi:mannose-6-phosphate isomerase-like protein (cupin superfamily)